MLKLGDFLGNERLVHLLRGAQLPPASLFRGPDGVGKKTLAHGLATLANCHRPVDHDICGCCSSCVKARSGHHPDILVTTPDWIRRFMESKGKRYNPRILSIEVTREIIRQAQFLPYEGRLHFFIIDCAEKMTDEAANALLKTLEEPPERTRLVLVTAYPYRLLPTIRSRCRTFSFQPLKREEIRRHLRTRVQEEEVELRSAFAGGSIGAALALDLKTTLADRDRVLDVLAQWIQTHSFERIYDVCERDPLRKLLKDRERVGRLLELMGLIVEDLYYVGVNTRRRLLNGDRTSQLQDLAGSVSPVWCRAFLNRIREAEEDLSHYVSPLMCFEGVWLKDQANHVGRRHRQI
ncbi:MAG: ATP-binding protein [Acidobacteriota bacterium]